jgi:hypothetical protein
MPTSPGRFLRDNAFLVAAVALPLVVVAFFVLSTTIPRWTVPPPRYDLLVRTRSWDQTGPRIAVDFMVQDGKLQAMVRPLPVNTSPMRSTLWLFDHQVMNAREIPIALPEKLADGEDSRTIVIDDFGGRRVLAQIKAPDGYEFQTRSGNSPGIVGDLFGMRRYTQTAALVNRGRLISIDLPSIQQYEYPEFVGWLIDE